ncbi:trypsin-like peptidase domain-containing protein, partial [Cohnella sp. REN36]
AFDIKSYGKPIGEGKDVAILKINAKDLPTISVDDTDGDGSAVSSAIQFAGYPGKADLGGFLDERSQLEATYSTGTISVSQKIMKNGAPVIQLNANLNPGNSGGPVLSES